MIFTSCVLFAYSALLIFLHSHFRMETVSSYWFFLYVEAALAVFATAAFASRRRTSDPLFYWSLRDQHEPTIARMLEIITYFFVTDLLFLVFYRRAGNYMPDFWIRPTMWGGIAICLATAFLCWSYSQNRRGYQRDIALSATVGAMIALAFEAVDYVGIVYKQDWIYVGGFYLLIPAILAFIATRIFADKSLRPYQDASVDEQLALWRLHWLALIFQPSWWEKFVHGSLSRRLKRFS
jgi:hypothetical protein